MVEPVIWCKAMSVNGRKYENRMCYVLVVEGYTALALVKEYSTQWIGQGKLTVYINIFMSVYIMFFSIIMFAGRCYQKIINVSVFYCALLLSDLISLGFVHVILKISIEDIMRAGCVNVMCAMVSKIIAIIQCMIMFSQKRKAYVKMLYKYKGVLVLVLVDIVCIIAGNDICKDTVITVLFGLIQIMLICITLYILHVIKNKDLELEQTKNKLEIIRRNEDLSQQLRTWKHDMSGHKVVITNLCQKKKYDLLEEYIKETFGQIEEVTSSCQLADEALAILLEELKRSAKERKIDFSITILMDRFYMRSVDLCALVNNLVQNAFEACDRLTIENKYVILKIGYVGYGYMIECKNTAPKGTVLKGTTKANKEEHGFGLTSISSIVKKYNGTKNATINPKHVDYDVVKVRCSFLIPKVSEDKLVSNHNVITN